MIKSFIFPFIGLIADLAILHFREVPTSGLIVAIVVFLLGGYWTYENAAEDTDNQFWPSATTTVVPVLILALASAS